MHDSMFSWWFKFYSTYTIFWKESILKMACTTTMFSAKFKIDVLQYTPEAYLEFYRTYMTKLFAEIFSRFVVHLGF